jgi:hypothetical protein
MSFNCAIGLILDFKNPFTTNYLLVRWDISNFFIHGLFLAIMLDCLGIGFRFKSAGNS